MTARLLLLTPFVLISLLFSLSWIIMSDEIPWVSGACTLIGIYSIIQIIANHKRFKLVDDRLVIASLFASARLIDLATIEHWHEHSFFIRGQKRTTVILFLAKEEKLIVDNTSLKSEFQELVTYLNLRHADRKKVSGFVHVPQPL